MLPSTIIICLIRMLPPPHRAPFCLEQTVTLPSSIVRFEDWEKDCETRRKYRDAYTCCIGLKDLDTRIADEIAKAVADENKLKAEQLAALVPVVGKYKKGEDGGVAVTYRVKIPCKEVDYVKHEAHLKPNPELEPQVSPLC